MEVVEHKFGPGEMSPIGPDVAQVSYLEGQNEIFSDFRPIFDIKLSGDYWAIMVFICLKSAQ